MNSLISEIDKLKKKGDVHPPCGTPFDCFSIDIYFILACEAQLLKKIRLIGYKGSRFVSIEIETSKLAQSLHKSAHDAAGATRCVRF